MRSRCCSVILMLMAVVVSASTLRAAPAPQGTKWALMVGIDRYESSDISALKYAVADVREFSQALVENAGFPDDHVFLMTSDAKDPADRPTNVNIVKRLGALAAQVGPNDTFLFYFSGHGFQLGEDAHFLSTVNADPSSTDTLEVSALPVRLLRDKIKKIQAQQVVFLIDACRNDPTAGKQARGASDNVRTAAFSRTLLEAAQASTGGPEASAVFFACAEGQRAYEWDEQGHSVFTYYLLDGLRGKAANGAPELTLSRLADYVQRQVSAWATEHNKHQTPDLRQNGAATIVISSGNGSAGGSSVAVIDTTARLRITTTPPGAWVYLDRKPLTDKVTPCTITIDLAREKSRAVDITVQVAGRTASSLVTIRRGRTTVAEIPVPIVVSQDGRGHFSTITEALKNAEAGALILVKPGLYDEMITISRQVTIAGDGPPDQVVIASTQGTCITMQTDSAELRSLSVRCACGTQGKSGCGIDVARGALIISDCDIASNSQACVNIVGPASNPTLRHCRIHDGPQQGFYLASGSHATIEDCEIYGNQWNVTIQSGSDPLIRRCRLHHARGCSFALELSGRGTIEDCDVSNDVGSAVVISRNANPILSRCKLHDSGVGGISIGDDGLGKITDCELFNNHGAGISVPSRGKPNLSGCSIHTNGAYGVWVSDDSAGVIQNCNVFDNSPGGVAIARRATPLIQDCRIHDNLQQGVWVGESGLGTLRHCEIYANTLDGISIQDGGNPLIQLCTISRNSQCGVSVGAKGQGTIEGCIFKGNVTRPMQLSLGCRVNLSGNTQ